MKHLKNFQSYNEGIFDFMKNPIAYREDMKVSKRMKENDIEQIFEKDPESKKENLRKSFLVHGKEKEKVAKLEISKVDANGRPVIELTGHEPNNPENITIHKFYYNQDEAIHAFLNYWESYTKQGQDKNKQFRLKKY